MKIKDISKKSLILFCIAFFVRIAASFILNSFENINYYEYGIMAENILAGKGFSFFANPSNPNEFAVGAYMPVGAVLYTVPFFLIKSEIIRNVVYLLANHLIAAISVVIIYKATSNKFNEKAALCAACLAALFPEFIFSSSTVVTTNFYHLFIALVLLMFSKDSKFSVKEITKLGLLSGIAILFRSEVALLVLILSFFVLKRSSIKYTLLYIAISISLVAPWTVRNYIVLDKFIPFTTNFGINLYRGHNSLYPGAWADDRMDSLKAELKFSEKYELDYIDLHKQEALKRIEEKPMSSFLSGFEKVIHLWVYYPYSGMTSQIVYILLWLLYLAASIIGIIRTKFKENSLVFSMLVYHSIVAFIFFSIPRYQTMMKYWLLPLAGYGIFSIIEYLKKRNG